MAVFPTCLVEYQNPAIGHDLVKVYERNGIECSLVEGAGLLRRAVAPQRRRRQASRSRPAKNDRRCWPLPFARARDIVVPQPTCGYVLKKDYVDYVGGPDAELVAAHTYDASEYLMKAAQGRGHQHRHRFRG